MSPSITPALPPNEPSLGNHTRPAIGQTFNPSRRVCGFYPPDFVGRQKNFTDGQKRLYERCVRWAGQRGEFWYSFDTMAVELGKSSRQVKRDMAILEKMGLIWHERRGKRVSNRYHFRYHAVFESDATSTSPQAVGEVTDLRGDRTSTSLGEVTPASHESCKENYVRESSSDECPTAVVTANSRDDDESSFHGRNTEPENPAELTGLAECPGRPDPLKGTDALPRWFLDDAARRIHQSKCWDGVGPVNLSLFRPPDLPFTAKIVEPWRNKGTAAFEDWTWSTRERGLGRKGKTSGPYVYGLFLSDSQTCASRWAPGKTISETAALRLANQQREAEEATAQEQRRQRMNTIMSVAEAARVAGATRSLHPRFVWLVGQRHPHISPGEMLELAGKWRSCPVCNNEGFVGSPLKRTLAFCECEIGRQEQIDREGDFIAEEIVRVHACPKSRLVQACRELKLEFTGDALEHAKTTVLESGETIEICLEPDSERMLSSGDVRSALAYLGEARPHRVLSCAGLEELARNSFLTRVAHRTESTRTNPIEPVTAPGWSRASERPIRNDAGGKPAGSFTRITPADVDRALAGLHGALPSTGEEHEFTSTYGRDSMRPRTESDEKEGLTA